MKPNSLKLIRMIVFPKAFGEKPPQPQEIQREQDEFFKKLLPQLDKELQNKKYFGGDDITVADIQYYNEISTIVNLTKKELVESELPNLAQWYNDRMSQLPDIMGLDKKLKEIISRHNLH
jgi:glutathione S-transferase